MLSVDFSPNEFINEIDNLLIRGVKDHKHPFHQFALSTYGSEQINQRMVVLRRWVLNRRTLMFHTDKRSPKIKDLKKNSHCSILFYSRPQNLQLRFKCISHIHQGDALADVLFNEASESQLEYYKYKASPSSKISKNSLKAYKEKKVDAKENFVVCVCNFFELELLYLNREQHIRILYEWDKHSQMTSSYLIP
mgnify:CR=1 FL=1